MKTIAAPACATAAITSSSRREPPGWTIGSRPRRARSAARRRTGRTRRRRAPRRVGSWPNSARLLDRDPDGVDAAHLAGADPDRLQVLHEHDRVRGDVLAHAPREDEVAPLRLVELAGDDLPAVPFLDLGVGVLDEHPAEHALVARARRASPARRSPSSRMRVFCLRPQRVERVLACSPGAKRTSTNCSASFSPSGASTSRLRTTTPPYAEIGSEASALSYASSTVVADRDAARVRVLDDHAGRQRELARERARAERSLRLLNESSFPCSCSTRERRWRRAPRSA